LGVPGQRTSRDTLPLCGVESMDTDSLNKIAAKFGFFCRECDSENVLFHFEPAHDYSEHSGSSASISMRCQDCDSDVVVFPY